MIHELLMKKFISVASSHFKYSSIHPSIEYLWTFLYNNNRSSMWLHLVAYNHAFVCLSVCLEEIFTDTTSSIFNFSGTAYCVGISNMEWDDVIKLITFILLMGQPANSQYLKLPLRQSRFTNWSLSHLGNVTFGEHLRSLLQINFKDTSVPCWTIPRFTVITKWIIPYFLQSSMQPTIHPASHPHQRST